MHSHSPSLSTMRSATRSIASGHRLGYLVLILAAATAAAPARAAVLYANGQPDPTYQSNAMRLWFKADAGVTHLGGAVSAWADQSTYAYVAAQATPANQPVFTPSGLNGKPVISWAGDDFLTIAGGPTGQQTMFIVYRDNSTASWVTPVGTLYTGAGSYHGHSDDTQLWTVPYTAAATTAGTSSRNGVSINGFTTGRPDAYSLDVHVATAALTQTITTIGADDCCSASRGVVGGIAEIIIYNAALSAGDINDIGAYLEIKYGLDTTFVAIPEPSTFALLGLGVIGLAVKSRRRRAAD